MSKKSYSVSKRENRNRRCGTGFTFIEVLIVLAITTLITTFALSYGTTSREQIALSVEEAKLVQIILRAKALAIGTFNQPSVPCGYGVHFDYDANRYALISYKPASCSGIGVLDPDFVTELQTFAFPASVVFEEGGNRLQDLLFIPPEPKTILNSDGAVLSGTPGFVYLGTRQGSLSVRITVSGGGQVTF